MTDKRNKIIALVSAILMAIALILECIPTSVKGGCLIGPNEYAAIHYSSYFVNPLKGGIDTLSVALFTILVLVFNVILLFKDKRLMLIFTTAVSFFAFYISARTLFTIVNSKWVIDEQMNTPFEIIIAILFLIELVLQFVLLIRLYKGSRQKNPSA